MFETCDTHLTRETHLGTTLSHKRNQSFGQAIFYLPNTSAASETKTVPRISLHNKMAELLMPKFPTQFNDCNSKSLNRAVHIKYTEKQC